MFRLNHLTEFAIGEDNRDRFLANQQPPVLNANRSFQSYVGKTLYNDPDIALDLFNLHYSSGYHDCTVQATKLAQADVFKKVSYLSDRRTLRKLVGNRCVQLPPNSFYLKREDFEIIAEKTIEGMLIIGCRHRYEESPKGVGCSFERLVTRPTEIDTRNYRVSFMQINEDVRDEDKRNYLLIRSEADAVNKSFETVELKTKKLPNNPRYGTGLNEDYYLNLYVQMALSDTNKVVIALHKDGRIGQVLEHNLDEVCLKAGLRSSAVKSMFERLLTTLELITSKIPAGRQAIVNSFASGDLQINLCPPNTYDLPLLSAEGRSLLSSEEVDEKGRQDKGGEGEVSAVNDEKVGEDDKGNVENLIFTFAKTNI